MTQQSGREPSERATGIRPLRPYELRRLELLLDGPRTCTHNCGISRALASREMIEPTGQVNHARRRVQYRITDTGRAALSDSRTDKEG